MIYLDDVARPGSNRRAWTEGSFSLCKLADMYCNGPKWMRVPAPPDPGQTRSPHREDEQRRQRQRSTGGSDNPHSTKPQNQIPRGPNPSRAAP